MKKGGLFSKSLYREAIRQTAALGGCCLGATIGMLLMGVMLDVGTALTTPVAERIPSFVDFGFGAPLLFVLAPLMVLVYFHFLDKRNQCDFYHALPHTRQQLAGSFLAAILTWIIGSLLATFALFALIYSIVPDSIAIINWAGSFHSLASIAAVLILLIGGTFLAVSLTGNVASNVLATGLILFAPRILILIAMSTAISGIPVVTIEDLPFPLGSYNLLFCSKFYTSLHAPIGAIVYTALLGVLYGGLGVWAFTRRKSECAGTAAISRGTQAVFRTLAAAPAMLGAAIVLRTALSPTIAEESEEAKDAILFGGIMSVLVLVLASFFAFLLYELITTRSGKRLLKILPTYGFVVLVAAAGMAVSTVTEESIAAATPAPDQVASVSLLLSNDEYYMLPFDNSLFYQDVKLRDVEIRDPEVCSMVANALKKEVDIYRGESNDGSYLEGTSNRLRIRLTDGGEMTRTITLSEEQIKTIRAALMKNEDYIRIMTKLPDETKMPMIFYSGEKLTNDQARQVYASLRQEIGEQDINSWIERFDYAKSSEYQINMRTIVGSDICEARLPITADHPKTLAMYYTFVRENADFETWLSQHPLNDPNSIPADISLSSLIEGTVVDEYTQEDLAPAVDGDSHIAEYNTYISSEELYRENGVIPTETVEAWNELIEWVRVQASKPFDFDKPFGRVSLSTWQSNGRYYDTSFYINFDQVPEAALDTLSNSMSIYWDTAESDSLDVPDEFSDPA